MRRVVLTLGLVSLMALLGAASASAVPRTATTATMATTATFTLTGNVAAGVRSAEIGDPVTFVFTMKNTGTTTGAERFLVITKVVGATGVHQGCVLPNGFEISPDGSSCEPGPLNPGQSSSAFIQALVAGATSGVTVRACVVNSSTGASGPCLTLSVTNPG